MLQIILLLFIVLDPFGNMVTINSLLQEMEPGRRRMVMLRESGIALLILLAAVFAGEAIMGALGLKPYALGIAGGIVLFMIAMGMVFPARRPGEEQDSGDPFIVPIAMPFIAGPSTISLVLLLAEKHDRLTVAAAVLIAGSISAIILTLTVHLRIPGRTRLQGHGAPDGYAAGDDGRANGAGWDPRGSAGRIDA